MLGLCKAKCSGLPGKTSACTWGSSASTLQLQRVGHQLLHRETCAVVVIRHRAAQDTVCESAGAAWHRSDFVFTTRYGFPIEPRNFIRH